MKVKSHQAFKYLLLCISMIALFPALSRADIERHVIETGTGFYYVVQKGDTLWDLSEKFSDSPWYWPEMWQHNPQILNPHLIYPGQRIRIYSKKWADTMETPARAEAPGKPARYYTYSGIDAIGFIRGVEADNYGHVMKVKEDKRLISSGDKIFIQPNGSLRLVEGNTYAIYRTINPVNDPVTDEYIGVQHIITGIAHITDIHEGYAVAMIDSSFRDIRQGDLITPFLNRDKRIQLRDPVPDLRGNLIKGEENQALIGEHMIAFINKGKVDNVKPGQTYNLFYQEEFAGGRGTDSILLTEESLGELIVLHTEETTSTVLITNSLNKIASDTSFRAAAGN